MYLKNGFTKVNSIEEAEIIANKVSRGEIFNILFESSVIKERFFSIIDTNRPDITIINCNSNKERFEEAVWNAPGLIIFNNINKCKDSDILNIIENNKGILVC